MVHSTLKRSDPAIHADTSPRARPALASPGQAPDYLERNRRAWDDRAQLHIARGRRAWEADELRWGLWDLPESELRLLAEALPDTDVIELGCGTAAISAWLTRQRLRVVAIDFSRAQLETAERLQAEFGVRFPLIRANGEAVPFDDASFDVAISEYGVSLWCDPRRWLPEAHRLLRADGKLVFFTNSAVLMACTPEDGGPAGDLLVRDYFSGYRVEFPGDIAVEFHLTHGHWLRLLRATGFVLEDLLEVRPPRGAEPRFELVSADWARRWPSEEIWVARKMA